MNVLVKTYSHQISGAGFGLAPCEAGALSLPCLLRNQGIGCSVLTLDLGQLPPLQPSSPLSQISGYHFCLPGSPQLTHARLCARCCRYIDA